MEMRYGSMCVRNATYSGYSGTNTEGLKYAELKTHLLWKMG